MDSNKTSDSDSTASSKSNDVKAGSSRAGLSIIGGVALIAIAGVGYWAYQGQQKADALADNLARMEAKLGGVHDHLQGIEQTQGDYKTQLESKVQELDQNVVQQTNRLQQLGGSQNWKLHEARYLLVLASERLQAFDDVTTAMRLVKAADMRVQEMASPNTLKVRQALANDLASLKALKVPDIQGTWVQLGALTSQFNQLEFFNLDDPAKRPVLADEQVATEGGEPQQTTQPMTEAQAATDDAPVSEEDSAWKRSLKDSWQELKGLVKVREYNPESFSLVLNSQEQAQLLAMMQMLVEQARWAATHKEQVIYQGSLEDLKGWVERYFVNDEVKAAVLAQIESLKVAQIQFEAPNLLALHQLDSYMQGANEPSANLSAPISNAGINHGNRFITPNQEQAMEPDPLTRDANSREQMITPQEAASSQPESQPQPDDVVPDEMGDESEVMDANEANEVNTHD